MVLTPNQARTALGQIYVFPFRNAQANSACARIRERAVPRANAVRDMYNALLWRPPSNSKTLQPIDTIHAARNF